MTDDIAYDLANQAMLDALVVGEPTSAGEPITVTKHSSVVQVTRDMALDCGLVEPTEAERAERDAWHAEYEQRKQAATEAWPVFVAALAAVTDPVARVVLNIHWNDNGECRGCEFSGYEAEPPGWPCSTTTSVAAAVGIVVAPDLEMAEQARQW